MGCNICICDDSITSKEKEKKKNKSNRSYIKGWLRLFNCDSSLDTRIHVSHTWFYILKLNLEEDLHQFNSHWTQLLFFSSADIEQIKSQVCAESFVSGSWKWTQTPCSLPLKLACVISPRSKSSDLSSCKAAPAFFLSLCLLLLSVWSQIQYNPGDLPFLLHLICFKYLHSKFIVYLIVWNALPV